VAACESNCGDERQKDKRRNKVTRLGLEPGFDDIWTGTHRYLVCASLTAPARPRELVVEFNREEKGKKTKIKSPDWDLNPGWTTHGLVRTGILSVRLARPPARPRALVAHRGPGPGTPPAAPRGTAESPGSAPDFREHSA
jgi:hypothetical protein